MTQITRILFIHTTDYTDFHRVLFKFPFVMQMNVVTKHLGNTHLKSLLFFVLDTKKSKEQSGSFNALPPYVK